MKGIHKLTTIEDFEEARDGQRAKLRKLYNDGAQPADVTYIVERQIAQINETIRQMKQSQTGQEGR